MLVATRGRALRRQPAAQPLAPGSTRHTQPPGRLVRLHADEDNNEDNNDDK